MASSKPQIEWVNIAKGLAMISVVIGHVGYRLPETHLLPLQTLVTGWHVPVFFLIAGFFIKEERLTEPVGFVRGKFHSLYRLLLYFYLPAVLLHNVFLRIGFYDTVTDYGGKLMGNYDLLRTAKEMLLAVFFAGREPILGAMWFVYVLFMALCGLSVVSWVLKKWISDARTYEWVRLFVLFMLCILSCSASRLYGLTIPRLNNTLAALWLIYCGYKLRNQLLVKFNNGWTAALSIVVVFHLAATGGGNALNTNSFHDTVLLTAGSFAALYGTCFISRYLEGRWVGRVIAQCGRDSFYIMGLHFLAFKLGTLALAMFGLEKPLAQLTAPASGSSLLFLYYTLVGVALPVGAVWAVKCVNKLLSSRNA